MLLSQTQRYKRSTCAYDFILDTTELYVWKSKAETLTYSSTFRTCSHVNLGVLQSDTAEALIDSWEKKTQSRRDYLGHSVAWSKAQLNTHYLEKGGKTNYQLTVSWKLRPFCSWTGDVNMSQQLKMRTRCCIPHTAGCNLCQHALDVIFQFAHTWSLHLTSLIMSQSLPPQMRTGRKREVVRWWAFNKRID